MRNPFRLCVVPKQQANSLAITSSLEILWTMVAVAQIKYKRKHEMLFTEAMKVIRGCDANS